MAIGKDERVCSNEPALVLEDCLLIDGHEKEVLVVKDLIRI